MGVNLQVLPQKRPEATILGVFDFTSQLVGTTTVSSGSVSAAVWSGVDPNPSAIVAGPPATNATQVQQTLTGGVAGVIYKLTILATTSGGQVLALTSYLAVVEDPL